MTLPKFHEKANSICSETLTFYWGDGLVQKEGGKYVLPTMKSGQVRGVFAPISFKLITTQNGDLIRGDAEVQVSATELSGAGITNPALYTTKIVRGNKKYTVIGRDDYTNYNGMYVIYVTAEVDGNA